MKAKILYCFLFFTLFAPISGHGQASNEGTNFWLSFMEHRDIGENTMVAMITSKKNTSGTISIPHRNWTRAFTIGANEVSVITLPSFAETLGSEVRNNNGIHITSVDKVSVYMHQYFGFRSEASVVLPTSSISNAYYVMTYEGVLRNSITYPSEFLIVGTQDETEVFITMSDRTQKGKPSGSTFSVTLNAGETYQVQAAVASGDLTGSFVVGDKDFALFAGNRWTEVPVGCGARDNLLEQMYPVDTWGKKFVTVPNDKINFDVFRILAAKDNTKVTVQGGTNQNYVLDAGEFVEYQQTTPSFIEASEGILVAQFAVGSNCSGHSLGDPSMVLLNSVEQTRDTVTLYNSSFQNITENFINVIFRAQDQDLVTFDGQKLADLNATLGTVGLNQEFGFARVQVNQGAHTIISAGCGVIATAYGYGTVESYAYGGGASFSPINAELIPEGGCLNDTVFFDTGLEPNRFSFQWDLGDGNQSTAAAFQHFYPELGSYPVELILTDECLNTVDTFNRDLLISLRQAVDGIDDVLECQGQTFQIGATDVGGARYEWNGPLNYFSEEQFPTIHNAQPEMSGKYAVIGVVSGCATFPAFIQVEVIPTPQPDLGPDTLVCTRDELLVSIEPGEFTSYRWQDNSASPSFEVRKEGQFWVEVTDENGCIGMDTVNLKELCPTEVYVSNAFSPNNDGSNDLFGVQGHDIISLKFGVYDRWGSLVFQTSNPDEHWDGYYKGQLLDSGVFLWMMEIEGYFADGTTFSEVEAGTVTLLR